MQAKSPRLSVIGHISPRAFPNGSPRSSTSLSAVPVDSPQNGSDPSHETAAPDSPIVFPWAQTSASSGTASAYASLSDAYLSRPPSQTPSRGPTQPTSPVRLHGAKQPQSPASSMKGSQAMSQAVAQWPAANGFGAPGQDFSKLNSQSRHATNADAPSLVTNGEGFSRAEGSYAPTGSENDRLQMHPPPPQSHVSHSQSEVPQQLSWKLPQHSRNSFSPMHLGKAVTHSGRSDSPAADPNSKGRVGATLTQLSDASDASVTDQASLGRPEGPLDNSASAILGSQTNGRDNNGDHAGPVANGFGNGVMQMGEHADGGTGLPSLGSQSRLPGSPSDIHEHCK